MLSTDNTVLIVIDVQGKLASAMHHYEQVFNKIERIIKSSQIFELPVLWSEQAPDKIGETIPQIRDLLLPSVKPIAKRNFSCWGSPEFSSALRAIPRSKVIIVGIETHVCVYQTARDLHNHGYEVHVVEDAVSSRDERATEIALRRMRHEGITVTSGEMVICELLKTADHPHFKNIMTYVKR